MLNLLSYFFSIKLHFLLRQIYLQTEKWVFLFLISTPGSQTQEQINICRGVYDFI